MWAGESNLVQTGLRTPLSFILYYLFHSMNLLFSLFFKWFGDGLLNKIPMTYGTQISRHNEGHHRALRFDTNMFRSKNMRHMFYWLEGDTLPSKISIFIF